MDQEDLSFICIVYCVPKDFELELPSPRCSSSNPPASRLGVYEEAFDVGIKFSILPFIFKFLKSYRIPLCSLTPNSLRRLVGFLVIYFLVEVQPSFFYSILFSLPRGILMPISSNTSLSKRSH